MPMIGRRIYPGMKRAAWGFMQSGDFPVPVGYWKFGKNVGSVAYDSSPYGNNGTIHGASWVKGYLGPGFSWDRLDDYVEVPTSASLDSITDEITISVKVKPSAVNVHAYALFKASAFYLAVTNMDAKVTLRFWDSEGDIKTTHGNIDATKIPALSWSDVDAVYDGTYAKIYIDSVEKYSSDVDAGTILGTPVDDLWIGGRAEEHYGGIMDEVILFNVGLTAAQIRQKNQGYR